MFARSQSPDWERRPKEAPASCFARGREAGASKDGFPSKGLGTSKKESLTQRRKGATKSHLRCAFASLRETSSSCLGDRMPAISIISKMAASTTILQLNGWRLWDGVNKPQAILNR